MFQIIKDVRMTQLSLSHKKTWDCFKMQCFFVICFMERCGSQGNYFLSLRVIMYLEWQIDKGQCEV